MVDIFGKMVLSIGQAIIDMGYSMTYMFCPDSISKIPFLFNVGDKVYFYDPIWGIQIGIINKVPVISSKYGYYIINHISLVKESEILGLVPDEIK
jgi:hypothetical protein